MSTVTDKTPEEPPDIELPDFDPKKFREQMNHRKPDFSWEPGDHVTIHVPPISVRRRIISSVGWGIALCFGLSILLELSGLIKGGWFVTAAICLVSILGCWIVIGWRYPGRQTEINWETDSVKIRVGNRTVTGSTKDVRAIVVRGKRHRKPPRYECEVMLDMGEDSERIIRTWRGFGKKKVYRDAASLAKELAQALDVEWVWKERYYFSYE